MRLKQTSNNVKHFVKAVVRTGSARVLLLVGAALLLTVLFAPSPNTHRADVSSKKQPASHTSASQKKPAPKKPATPAKSKSPANTPAASAKVNPKVTTNAARVVTPSPRSNVKTLKPAPPSSTSTSSGSSNAGSASPSQQVSYTSTNWSGYLATDATFTSVSGSWVVPTATGNGRTVTADGTWIGIGGVTSSDLIQVGTNDTVRANGQVSSAAFYELLPASATTISTLAVSPGDSMSAVLSEIAAGQWSISITDQTTHQTFTTTVTYSSSHSSAEWIEEDPSFASGGLIPFDNFGSVTFTGAANVLDGKAATIEASNAAPVTLVDASGRPEAVPSALSASSFTVTQSG